MILINEIMQVYESELARKLTRAPYFHSSAILFKEIMELRFSF